jgi:hypothetical protein
MGGIPVPQGEEQYTEVDGVTGIINGKKLLQKQPAIPDIDLF